MPGKPPRLTTEALNRTVLGRQLLLARAACPLPQALERVGGLQAQYAPSMYVGLWSRLAGFERARLTSALEQREVVQGTLIRSTIHLVSAGDYWPLCRAVRDPRRAWWLRAVRDPPDARAMAAAARVLRPRLARGPLRRGEIADLVGPERAAGVGLWIDLVRIPPSGTWERRRADLYASAEQWLGRADWTSRDALAYLARRYLGAFGPAPAADLASWAGLTPRTAAALLARLPGLRRLRGPDGEELLDLEDAPLVDAATPAPVRFLPTWDAVLLVHARRAAILPEAYRPLIFSTRIPQSRPTFLVDGAVAGAWLYERGAVRIEPFRELSASEHAEVGAEAERIAAFHA
jgi:hypothetical protein